MTLRVGVALPQVVGDEQVDPGYLRRTAELADSLGFDSVWVQEEVLGSTGTLDALTTLTYVASFTQRVDLGVAVLLGGVLDPVALAKATATLDQLSGGRLILGIGLGANREDYPAHGVPVNARAARFEWVLRSLLSLWTDDASGAVVRPLPRQHPHPPLWFGGSSQPALERAARFGTGFIGGGASTIDDFVTAAASLRLMTAGQGPFRLAKRVYLACTDHVADAESRLLRWVAEYYGDHELARRVSVAGDTTRCIEQLSRIIDAGATDIILNFVFDEHSALRGAMQDFVPVLKTR
ncbi:luciferase [Mycolicibacterium murale]|uniref:Luciferase n=1 Tax=Mycolicibacterium murale TaxID=182220 RepID=A0A7I9WLW7_9MYCO|nr:LLM class flavin-dependent oxidoreductase [Mycolicibacterium murale]MCV7180400.1 LLM class flavin-dependent oxidoreductase [Mycolicibacterium murale]GFG58731.1 luciferase [Mycolicibacterium murale]